MEAANIARVIALRAGIPESVPAVTVHRNCASGFEAFTTASERLAAGRGSVFIVGGAESMSQVPMLFKANDGAANSPRSPKSKIVGSKARRADRVPPGDFEPRVGLKLGLTDPVCGLNMGETAELLAREAPNHAARRRMPSRSVSQSARCAAAEASSQRKSARSIRNGRGDRRATMGRATINRWRCSAVCVPFSRNTAPSRRATPRRSPMARSLCSS